MEQKYVASPYTYGAFNAPTSWGIWNREAKSWTAHPPAKRQKDAEAMAKELNGYLGPIGRDRL